jgi:hypothetical protein
MSSIKRSIGELRTYAEEVWLNKNYLIYLLLLFLDEFMYAMDDECYGTS